jgi:hypothetical protein
MTEPEDTVTQDLPNRRQSVEGETLDGDQVRLAHTIARKLYRCPGCGDSIEIGSAHTLVQYLAAESAFHQHWHRGCAAREVLRDLKRSRVVPAT